MTKRKYLKIALSLVLCVSLLTGMAMVADAASNSDSASGTLNGTTCTASLTMGSSSANARTSSGFTAAGHTVSVTYTFTYVLDGEEWYKTVANNGSGTSSASATAYGSGASITSKRASSQHKVTYNGQNWSTSLSVVS